MLSHTRKSEQKIKRKIIIENAWRPPMYLLNTLFFIIYSMNLCLLYFLFPHFVSFGRLLQWFEPFVSQIMSVQAHGSANITLLRCYSILSFACSCFSFLVFAKSQVFVALPRRVFRFFFRQKIAIFMIIFRTTEKTKNQPRKYRLPIHNTAEPCSLAKSSMRIKHFYVVYFSLCQIINT